MFLWNSLLIFGQIVTISHGFSWQTYSKYHHPTKRLVPDIYTGGLLTKREIEYLAAAGFGTILSISENNETLTEYNGIEGEFLSNLDEIRYARQLGMDSSLLHVTYSAESAYMVSTTILHLKKPIYFHCEDGYRSSLFGELHLFLSGAADSTDFFTNSATLGYDFQSDPSAVNFVNDVMKTSFPVTEPSLELTLPHESSSYRYYYWSHRVGNDMWYTLGQILDTQTDSIVTSGYKSVISFRSTGEATIRLPTDPSTGPIPNHEYSDDQGLYNADFERAEIENAGLKFFYLPVTGSESWSVETLNAYEPSMDEAASLGPVLTHCASGYRSSGYVIAYLGRKQKKCTDWALKEARRIGYSFDQNSSDEQVVAFFQKALQC